MQEKRFNRHFLFYTFFDQELGYEAVVIKGDIEEQIIINDNKFGQTFYAKLRYMAFLRRVLKNSIPLVSRK